MLDNVLFIVFALVQFSAGIITIPMYIFGAGLRIIGMTGPADLLQRKFCWQSIGLVGIWITGAKIIHLESSPLIDRGYILANHRSWFDFAIDPTISRATSIARAMAAIPIGFSGLQSLLERRILFIIRGKSSARDVAKMVSATLNSNYSDTTNRVLFFPEGTRRSYDTLASADDLERYIRKGLLLTLYQMERGRDAPNMFQLQITSNKETVMNEKKCTIVRGTVVRTTLSPPIDPSKFATDELFLAEIRRVWYDCYCKTHGNALPATHESSLQPTTLDQIQLTE